MAVEVGDVVRITAKMEQGGDDVQNVFHIQHNGSSSVADSTFLADAISWLDGAYDYINDYQGDALSYESVEAYNVTQGAPIGEDVWDTLTSGDDSTAQESPKQVAALVRFPTATARSQGRKFIGGLTEADLDNGGVLTSAFTTALGQWALDIIACFASDSQDFNLGNWNPTLSRFAAVTGAIINTYNAIQRRRAAGVGS